MKKDQHIQKKKTPVTVALDILFKGLVAVAIIIFLYIAYDNVDFSSSGLSFSSNKKSEPVTYTPGPLKWFDDFKGVENVPDKNAEKNSNGSNSGFKYEGFNK